MKKISIFVLAIVITASLTACFRNDIRTITVKVPQMKSAACSTIIQSALMQTDGVKIATPDLQNHTIDVTYNSVKLAIKNVEFIIAEAGFDANKVPANEEARKQLPEECR